MLTLYFPLSFIRGQITENSVKSIKTIMIQLVIINHRALIVIEGTRLGELQTVYLTSHRDVISHVDNNLRPRFMPCQMTDVIIKQTKIFVFHRAIINLKAEKNEIKMGRTNPLTAHLSEALWGRRVAPYISVSFYP